MSKTKWGGKWVSVPLTESEYALINQMAIDANQSRASLIRQKIFERADRRRHQACHLPDTDREGARG